ncbi:hypothetical protein KAMAJI_01580 [Serratia phage vB_SmaM-Kamaji]|nr:hypothetical protein KAMAJI_01580 [Serratia phage vB_SmaM-Kamaji]
MSEVKNDVIETTRALTKVEKDQYNGSKRRRKPLTPKQFAARETGVAKILLLLQRATNGRVRCTKENVYQTLFRAGI